MSPGPIEVPQATVMGAAFALITAAGVRAARWRRADLTCLEEWALAGRKLGGVLTCFLPGGSIYTTSSFVAGPALVFRGGAIGFFALPFLIVAYVVPPLRQRAHDSGHLTPADFVRDRFGSRPLAAVACAGLAALIPTSRCGCTGSRSRSPGPGCTGSFTHYLYTAMAASQRFSPYRSPLRLNPPRSGVNHAKGLQVDGYESAAG
jgi:SSS family solute:Na+ symporter